MMPPQKLISMEQEITKDGKLLNTQEAKSSMSVKMKLFAEALS